MINTPTKFVKLSEARRLTGIETFNLRNMLRRNEIVGMRRGKKIWLVGLNSAGEVCYVEKNG